MRAIKDLFSYSRNNLSGGITRDTIELALVRNIAMSDWIQRIDKLDLGLYETIPSQTSDECRRSLLAVQRATAIKRKNYVYLEIGSHLGGTIQPHLADDRCQRIYSIDPRPSQQPDDRKPGFIAHYENNSTERMLALLKGMGVGALSKIVCFDFDASEVDPGKIKHKPDIVFIDGEHTLSAVCSDFKFSNQIVGENGTILFHDFSIVHGAIREICSVLKKHHRTHIPLKLEGEVFAIFFDQDLVYGDPYLSAQYRKNKNFLIYWGLRVWLKEILRFPSRKTAKS